MSVPAFANRDVSNAVATHPLLEVDGLTVEFWGRNGWTRVVNRASFTVNRGEAFGLVGESGSGKSTTAYSLLGYRRPNSRIRGGTVRFDGRLLDMENSRELRAMRGRAVSLVPQNHAGALNPRLRIARQLREAMEVHRLGGSRRARSLKVLKLLEQVGLPPAETARKYPHELSGGQRQRVAIAMALACDPPLVVLDEPTTDLDVTTQAQIIDLLNRLRQANSISLVYVTHNLAVVKEMCDRVAVMYAGEVVEEGPTDALFASPRHPYTRALIDAVPRLGGARAPLISLRGLLRRAELPPGCPLAPRCEFADALCFAQQQALLPVSSTQRVACRRWQDVAALLDVRGRTDVVERRRLQTDDGEPLLVVEDLDCTYGRKGGLFRRTAPRTVVREAHFDLKRGETLSLVGQSGSGKTTIARAVAGLLQAADGEITYKGRPLGALVAGRPKSLRREIQIILQNPDESLNPRQRVEQIIGRPLTLFGSCRGSARRGRVEQLLAEVRLDPSFARRYPSELSGGERQRVAIARALAAEPELLVCDEVLSALDVSVQAEILDLLRVLQDERKLAYLFISHDLAVVRAISHRVGVLYHGRLREFGDVEAIFAPPYHPYTHRLLLASPEIDDGHSRTAAPMRSDDCPYGARCCLLEDAESPSAASTPWQIEGTHMIRCRLSLEELRYLQGG